MSKEPKKFATVEAAKIALYSALIVAVFGAITAGINSYSNYMSSRVQVEFPIFATQTAEAKLTLASLSQTPIIIQTSTFTPTITETSIPATPTLEEASPIPTNTNRPTALPIPATPDIHLGIENGCIENEFWTPNDGEDIKTDDSGCWQLSDWGFFVQDAMLYLLPTQTDESQSHGLYTSLSGNVDINFKFQVDKIETGARQANIRFGVVSENYNDGKFLAYHYLPEYPDRLYPKLWQDGDYGSPFSVNLKTGKTQQVTISVRGNFLTIILDGQVVLDKLVLRFDNRRFLFDYFLPPSSNLSAHISEFSIEEK